MAGQESLGPTEFARELDGWFDADPARFAAFRRAPYSSVAEYLDRLRPFQALLYDAGWSRCGWPVALGGLGGAAALRGVLYDRIYRRGLDLPRGFELLEVVGPTIARFAPALAARDLPPLVRGDLTVCQGFSEPEAGSDLAALRLRADRTPDGFRLNGQKTWVSLANVADRCLLLARTGLRESRHRGLTAFWLDLSRPGVKIVPITFLDGRDEFAEIFLEDVDIPADRLVGDVDGGWNVAMYLLQFERGNYAWQRQAWLLDVLRAAVAVPSAADQGALAFHRLGAAWLDVTALRSRSRRTLLTLAEGEHLGARTSVDKLLMTAAEQSTFDAARALTFPATEAASDRSPWEDDWFYSRAASIYGGASEVQRDIVAEKLLGLPR